MVLVLYHNNEMCAMKKVLVFAVCVLFSLPVLARFDDRHSLMPGPNPFITEPEQKPEAGGAQGDSLLIDRRTLGAIPKAAATAVVAPADLPPESREGIILQPLPPGRRYFTDAPLSVSDAEVSKSARVHVVSFNTREAAERALANMASRYPRASRFAHDTVREQVGGPGGQLVWRGFFVGDKDELALFCKDITAAGEWCNIR